MGLSGLLVMSLQMLSLKRAWKSLSKTESVMVFGQKPRMAIVLELERAHGLKLALPRASIQQTSLPFSPGNFNLCLKPTLSSLCRLSSVHL